MLPRERQIEIVKLVNRQGTVKTTELAERLDCTEETIRRDLDVLEKAKKVVRSHGGAMSIQDSLEEIQHHKRESREVKEKKQIGELAASFLEEGETIFIDESSTALAMIDFLPHDIEFSIITTSLLVSRRVSAMKNVKLYLLGGLYDEMSYSFGGYIAEQAMSYITVDRFYLSSKGVDVEQGATEANEERARLKRSLLKSAKWTCVLSDYTKLGFKARFSFMPTHEIDLLITDDSASEDVIEQFNRAGLKTLIKK